MKKPDPHIITLWILGIIAVIYFTGEFNNYNENWNKIRRQGLTPALVSGDGITNQISGNHYNLEFYQKHGIKNSYWNPYIFSGMASVFSGVQHPFVTVIFAVSGTALSFLWGWCYVFDLIPVFIFLWLGVLKPPVTVGQIAINREDQKICKLLLLIIAGWLVFYWFYAEIK